MIPIIASILATRSSRYIINGSGTRATGLCCGRVIGQRRLEGETTLRSLPCAFAETAVRMRRRDFIALAGGAVAWTVSAGAQTMPVIGYLGSENPERYRSRLAAFRDGLAESGYASYARPPRSGSTRR